MIYDLSLEHRVLVERVTELARARSSTVRIGTTGPPHSPPRTFRTWSEPG